MPDIFGDFDDGLTAADYPQQRLYRPATRLHPQYVLENGGLRPFCSCTRRRSFPLFTRHDFSGPVSYVDFTITFEGDDGQRIDDVKSGAEAINGGLGWPSPRVGDGGQPHHLGDHPGGRDHLRCPVHILHRPGARR